MCERRVTGIFLSRNAVFYLKYCYKILLVGCSWLSQMHPVLPNSYLVLILSENLLGLSLSHTVLCFEVWKKPVLPQKRKNRKQLNVLNPNLGGM